MGFLPTELDEPAPAPRLGIEWVDSDCPLCGGRRWTPLVEAPDRLAGASALWFLVVQCADCGLCFTNPRPNPGTIGRFYPADYAPHRDKPRKPRWWHQLWLWKPIGPSARRYLPVEGQGRLLDFGCGNGSFLTRMHRQGWDVTGIDCSPVAAEHVRYQSGMRVLTGTLPHANLRGECFDVITMWQSLEHVHEPARILEESRRLLTPKGKLIVAVPNIDSLPFRWFGHAWHGLDLPRHLTHFAPWTLRLMLHRAGFRTGAIRMVRHASWLRASARTACQYPEGTRLHRWLRRRPASTLATWYSYFTGQCDCMMVTAWKR